MGGAAGKSDIGQQRRAGHARLRVGLHDAGDRGGDVEIGAARFLDHFGQFLGAETAPPVEFGQRRFRQRRSFRAAVIGLRNIEPGIELVGGKQAAAERQHQAESLQHGHD